MHRRIWASLAMAALGLSSCAHEREPVDQACAEAWERYEDAAVDPLGDDETAATATLNECSNPAEWWNGSEPHRAATIGAKAQWDTTLTAWCTAQDGPTAVCEVR